jgi:hypothetical protein
MNFVPVFVVSILAATGGSARNPAMMRLIVRRAYAHLEERLRRAFEERHDVEVVTDRRHGERRVSARPVAMERRQADRRTPKDEIMQVVIEGDPLTIFR